jgi:pilus assembly protein CpaE
MSIQPQPIETRKAAGSDEIVMSTSTTDTLGSRIISIALISPAELRRKPISDALAEMRGSITREIVTYPELDDVAKLVESDFDVIIVELDSNPEYALDLVESICANSSTTVMVYSSRVFPEMLVRCMRAGAREFLTMPITSGMIAEAMIRAAVRRPIARPAKKTAGKLMVFIGAKGGSGATTLASNFAVALAQESSQSTLLIDLNLPLGDAGLELGIHTDYSTATALQSFDRLDFNFLSSLLVKHSSGLFVLPAPDKYTEVQASSESVQKLLTVTRQNFDYVVIDAGSRFGATGKVLFGDGATVYLVTQVGISDLRNSNRLISELLRESGARIEIVLNRFTPRGLLIDEESITKALTMPAQWKVPNDYAAARNAQNMATPLVLKDSPISRVISQMAKTATGAPANPEKKKRFGLF